MCLSSVHVPHTHTHTHTYCLQWCSLECVESFWPVCFCSVTPSAQAGIHAFTAIVMLLLLIHSSPFKICPPLPSQSLPSLSSPLILFFSAPISSQVKSRHSLLLFLLQWRRSNEMLFLYWHWCKLLKVKKGEMCIFPSMLSSIILNLYDMSLQRKLKRLLLLQKKHKSDKSISSQLIQVT